MVFLLQFVFVALLYGTALATPDYLQCFDAFKNLVGTKPFAALAQARKTGEYPIQILVKGGRYIILMGETHDKSPELAQIGLDVAVSFSFRAYEGFDPGKTWGGKLAKIFAFLRPDPRDWSGSTIDEITLDQFIVENFGTDPLYLNKLRGIYRSPDEFKKTADEIQAWVKLLNSLLSELKKLYDKHDLGNLAPIDLDKMNFKFSFPIEGSDTDEVVVFPAKTIKDIIETVPDSLPKGVEARSIWLEEGHLPDLNEQIQSLFWETTIGLKLLKIRTKKIYRLINAFTFPLFFSHIFMDGYPSIIATGFGTILLGLRIAIVVNVEVLKGNGRLTARDPTMVRNILKALEDHIDDRFLLVVVGERHLPGMSRLLCATHGFREVSWDQGESASQIK